MGKRLVESGATYAYHTRGPGVAPHPPEAMGSGSEARSRLAIFVIFQKKKIIYV